MDYMDIDQVPDVPDTPDRLAAQDVNGRQVIEIGSDSSAGNTYFSGEPAKNQLRARSKLVPENEHRKSLFFRSGKNVSVSNNYGDFKGKALSTPQSPNRGRNGEVDLMEWRGPAQVFHNDVPNAALEDCFQAKELVPTNGFSSLHGISNSSATTVNTCGGKEKVIDTCKGGSGLDRGKGPFGDSLPEVGNGVSSPFYSIPSPRVGGQIRFVRDGCISPQNIGKAKQFAENHSNGSSDLQNDRGTSSNSSLNLARDLIAGGNNVNRREGAIFQPSSEELAAETIDLATRGSIAHNEQICGTSNASGDAFRCFEGFGGWRNTRNRMKKLNLPLIDEGQHLSRTMDDPSDVNQRNESNVVRRDSGKGISSRIDNADQEDQNAFSFQNGCSLTEDQAVSLPMAHSVHVPGHRGAASTLMKRQKQGSTSSNHGQSFRSAAVDSEFVVLASSKEPSNSRSTRNHSDSDPRILDPDHPVIEVDGFSPEVRYYGSDNRDASSNGDSDDRARQVEADEMLARELQEQLYHESPGVEDEEFDALITSARALREESSQHSYSGGSHPVFHPSGSLTSNSYRRSRSPFSQNPSMYGGPNAQGPASARLTRLRSRVRSQLPRISYRESGSIFPPNMDLDMRMHILEALEAFSDMEMAGNLLQVDREFNENDYEMLLALDENNHHHVGASLEQINSLPLSTVQGDNIEEACAICLENPTCGDSIRHLPCLHKFHKDCIDTWLRRKTSCPICKSSIT